VTMNGRSVSITFASLSEAPRTCVAVAQQ